MFTGDSSGDWLYEALHRYGFASQPHSVSRDDGMRLERAYVTASGRCAPPGNRPTPAELERCRPFLEAELRLLPGVRVVVLLGRIAWERWLRAAGWWARLPARERPRFAHGAEAVMPDGTHVVCSYHPSRQNTNTGRLTRAMWHAVFARAREIADLSAEAAAVPPARRARLAPPATGGDGGELQRTTSSARRAGRGPRRAQK